MKTYAWIGRSGLALLLAATVAILAAAVGLPATSGSGTAARTAATAAKSKRVVISTRKVRGLGPVLVDGKGLTLYMFVPDRRKHVTCTSTCAVFWPPVFLPAYETAVARGKVRRKLLGSDRDPAGGRVVTYKRWPLYTYVGDTAPGMATGQAVNLNGGLWYVLSPTGRVVRKRV